MKSWISKRFVNKVSSDSTEEPKILSLPPDQIINLPSQISRLDSEFQKFVPKSHILSLSPTLSLITPSHLILSDSSQVLFFDLITQAMTSKDYSLEIQFMSYSQRDSVLYLSGSRFLIVSLSTLEIISELPNTLTFIRAFPHTTLSISSDTVQSLDHLNTFKPLYQHSEAFLLDSNENYVFSLSSNLVKVFSNDIDFQYENFDRNANFMICSNNFLAVCGEFYCVLIIKLNTWETFTVFSGTKFYWADFKNESDVLVCAGSHRVMVKDLVVNRGSGVLIKNEKQNRICGFLPGSQVFACADFDLKVFQEYDLPEMNDNQTITIKSEIKGLVAFNNILIVYTLKEIFTLDFEYSNLTSTFHSDDKDIFTVIGFKTYIVVSLTGALLVFNSEFHLDRKLKTSVNAFGVVEFNEDFVLISEKSVQLFNSSENVIMEFPYNKKIPTCWTLYQNFIIVGDSEGGIKLINLSTGMAEQNLSLTASKILSISVLENMSYLLSATDRNLIKIWNLRTFESFHTIDSNDCFSILAALGHYCFSLSKNKRIEIWDLNDFNLLTSIDTPKKMNFFLSINNKIVAAGKKTVTVLNNPLTTKHIQVFGTKNEDCQTYRKQVLNLISAKSVKNLRILNNCFISPFNINLFILSACFNNKEVFEIESKKSGFHPTSAGETVFSICMSKNFEDLTRILIKNLKQVIEKNPYSLFYLENSLLDFNKRNVSDLHKFFRIAMGKSLTKNLPKFCISPKSLPIILQSESIFTVPGQFMSLGNYSNLGQAITFSHSYIKISTCLGSQQSISFIKGLMLYPNPLIFKTQFVKTILTQKWKLVKPIIMIQGAIYSLYLTSLAIFLTTLKTSSFLILPFVLSNLLLLYEFFQLFSDPSSYLSDLWNLIDLSRAFLFFSYSLLFWLSDQPYNTLLAVTIFLTWSRGITYFRIFSPTRYYINLLFAVIQDMSSFFIIFFYSIVGFGLVFFTLSSQTDYFEFLTSTYVLNFGQMDTTDYDKLQWLLLLLVTVFNPIIMLNLLISIMGDTYDRVKRDFETADLLGLCYLIVEVERLMFWRRGRDERKYLHLCEVEKREDLGNGAEKYLKDIQRTVKMLGMEVMSGHNMIMKGMAAVQGTYSNYERSLGEIKQKLGIR